MCTVLLRWAPNASWPLLLAAVRDEFLDRPWEHPAAHWPDRASVIGGRDIQGGGTWLAVDRAQPAVAALLNGFPLGPLPDGTPRPTRGNLVLAALAGQDGVVPGVAEDELAHYDTFHLLRLTRDSAEIWSWDGVELEHQPLPPGDHIVVNLGLDAVDDPLVPHFQPLLDKLPSVDPNTGWGEWNTLLEGDGLDVDDPRALIVSRDFGEGHRYGSSSAALVGLSSGGEVRFDFTATPQLPDWYQVAG